MQDCIEYENTDVVNVNEGITDKKNTDGEVSDDGDMLTSPIVIMREEECLKAPEHQEHDLSRDEQSSWLYILSQNYPNTI